MSAVMNQQIGLLADDHEVKWQAVLAKDARFDGQFVFAVSSTGIYCRPSCPSRRARRENVQFFKLPEAAEQEGYRACKRCHPRDTRSVDHQVEMAQRVCRLIENNDGESLTLAALSASIGVSPFHLQRTFKSIMGVSPSEYAEACRIKKFKQSVREGEAITNAIYDAGYGSSSRLYETAAAHLGMTPASYGKGGRGAVIDYAIVDCPLGKLLVATTAKGVCSVKLGDSDAVLKEDLLKEFPLAEVRDNEETLRAHLQSVLEYLANKSPRIDLPLDIRATAFQRQVWEQLRAIPLGETHSYTEVARAIGHNNAVRAVGRACATNPVALVVPCHRVIREDQSLGGYRWGLERKKRLLRNEKEMAK